MLYGDEHCRESLILSHQINVKIIYFYHTLSHFKIMQFYQVPATGKHYALKLHVYNFHFKLYTTT